MAKQPEIKVYRTTEAFQRDLEKRDGWSFSEPVRDENAATEVETYTDANDFKRDAESRAKDGWRVTNTVENQRRSGCLRILLTGGLGLIFFKPKPQIIVTYTQTKITVLWHRPSD